MWNTFKQYADAYGAEVAGRAEMLAAMDCLMHHLKDADDFEQWRMNAIPARLEWHILDNEPIASGARLDQYVLLAQEMDDNQFNCVVRTFADIMRGQCFMKVFNPDAFSPDTETI